MREEQNSRTSEESNQESNQQAAGPGQSAADPSSGQAGSQTGAVQGSEIEPVAPISGEGQATEVEAYGLSLQGVTRARFNGGSFRTTGVQTGAGSGCAGCDGGNCIQVSGTLVIDYRVTTTVTLPAVTDFPDLTPCQRQRVQDAITNVLAPHEQQHVTAFSAYNGSTQQAFSSTLCRDQFEAFIRDLVAQEEGPRQASAQSVSDALDPFNFEVDLDCTD